MQDSFVFYRSFHEALKDFNFETYGKMMFAINDYALNGKEPELEGTEKSLFTLIKPQIDANIKRKVDGMKGGRPKKNIGYEKEKPLVLDLNNHRLFSGKPNVNDNVNVNVNVNDNVNVNVNDNKKAKHFIKPTFEELETFIKEKNYSVNPEKFISYYESNGWKVGKNPMKDWKSAVRTWNTNNGLYRDKKEIEADKNAEDLKDYFLNRKLP